MSDIAPKQGSVLQKAQQAVSRVVDRVRFELSFPSRESRDYFNRSQSDLKTPHQGVARTVARPSAPRPNAKTQWQVLAAEVTCGADRAQFQEPANDRGRDTARETGR